jgi:hypothetical protein
MRQRFRIRIKEKVFWNLKRFQDSRINDLGCSSRIPDLGVKKAPDPGSATLLSMMYKRGPWMDQAGQHGPERLSLLLPGLREEQGLAQLRHPRPVHHTSVSEKPVLQF